MSSPYLAKEVGRTSKTLTYLQKQKFHTKLGNLETRCTEDAAEFNWRDREGSSGTARRADSPQSRDTPSGGDAWGRILGIDHD